MTPWLIGDWRTLSDAPWTHLGLALVSIVCGAIIGSEREKHEKAAGLRTVILVSLGSCAFTMASFIFESKSGDSGRVAAQIVTGIGFLGAGVIMHGRNTTVNGTTTAATIWTTAAIGMTAGAGYAGGALGLSILVRGVLSLILLYETHIAGERNEVDVQVDYEPKHGITRVRMERLLVDYRVSTVAAEWTPGDSGVDRLSLRLHLRRVHLRELLDEIVSIAEVKSIRETLIAQTPQSPPRPSP